MIGRVFFSVCLFSFCLINFISAAPKILLESSVDQSLITQADTVLFSVKVSAEDQTVFNELSLPDFSKDFSIVDTRKSSSFRMINGVVSRSQTRAFRLKPLRLGEIEIPPARLDFKNVTYLSSTTSVHVVTANKREEGVTDSPVKKDKNIFIETQFSKGTVFVGEPVNYDLIMYRRMQLWGQIHYSVPTFKGFWPETIGTEGDASERVDGTLYYVTPIMRVQLLPTEAGEYTFDPATVMVQTNVFGARVRLTDNPVTLNVLPLPIENKPAEFSNLVGEFDVRISNGRMGALKENQPISIMVTVSGTGNLQHIQEVDIDNDDNFNVYLSRYVDTYGGPSNTVISRTFEYVVLPRVSGTTYFPQFSINYFSKELLDYQSKHTQKMTVKVLPDNAVLDTGNPKPEVRARADASFISTSNRLSVTDSAALKKGVNLAHKKSYGAAIYTFIDLQQRYPFNHAIRHNLSVARGLMTEDIGRGQVRRFYYDLSLRAQPILRVVLLVSVALSVFFLGYITFKKRMEWGPVLCFVMVPVVLVLSMTLMVTSVGKKLADGVVIPSKIALKSGPSLALDTKVIVYSGTVVDVLGKRNGFTKVSLENDIEGWLDETALRYFD